MTARAELTAADVQVFAPYRAGLPRLGPYLRQLWDRRAFAREMARTQLRTQNFDTVLGQVWLVLNPLLLTGVYYLLVSIISPGRGGPEKLAHIMAGLFAFYFFSGCVSTGAASIVSSGKLILNTAFPKLLLPLSSVLVSLFRFLPTLIIYAIMHLVVGLGFGWNMFYALPAFLALIVFATGCAMIFATLNVYFRDTRSFLPYILRIWLYVSPILYYAQDVPSSMQWIKYVNPLFPMIGTWGDALVRQDAPAAWMLPAGAAWAAAALLAGGFLLMSREREFAVRI